MQQTLFLYTFSLSSLLVRVHCSHLHSQPFTGIYYCHILCMWQIMVQTWSFMVSYHWHILLPHPLHVTDHGPNLVLHGGLSLAYTTTTSIVCDRSWSKPGPSWWAITGIYYYHIHCMWQIMVQTWSFIVGYHWHILLPHPLYVTDHGPNLVLHGGLSLAYTTFTSTACDRSWSFIVGYHWHILLPHPLFVTNHGPNLVLHEGLSLAYTTATSTVCDRSWSKPGSSWYITSWQIRDAHNLA